MRKSIEILNDGKRTDLLILEVLLDIRELLLKEQKRAKIKKSK